MFLARKITRAKWETGQELSAGEISADAVTADLKTQGNALSFWQCHTATNSDVKEVALAIAAARDHADRLDIVWLVDNELRADGQTLRSTDGRTPVTDLVKRHVDVYRLDYVRLGNIAHHVVRAIKNKRCLRLTKRQVTDLLMAAVERNRIDLSELSDSLQTEIGK